MSSAMGVKIEARAREAHPGIPGKGNGGEATSVTVEPELRTLPNPVSTQTAEFTIHSTAPSSRRMSARRSGFSLHSRDSSPLPRKFLKNRQKGSGHGVHSLFVTASE